MMDSQEDLNKILTSFKVKARCVSYNKIRNISLYDLYLSPGTRVKDIIKFSDEISLAMKSKTRPLIKVKPELGIVRLEVVDENPGKIVFFEDFRKIKLNDEKIPMYLGSSVDGNNLVIDLFKHPHTLIAGSTGSGKSTLLHSIMANALSLQNTMICVIDSKNVEFAGYSIFKNVSVATDYNGSMAMLKFLYEQMEFRYNVMNDRKSIDNDPDFPNIIFIIDEFADLIMQDDKNEFYTLLCRLAQKCRAAGIYCIIATQRPSVDIIKGAIKANFPARISCQVASHIDSKVILDATGAE